MLTEDEVKRYERQIRISGEEGKKSSRRQRSLWQEVSVLLY